MIGVLVLLGGFSVAVLIDFFSQHPVWSVCAVALFAGSMVLIWKGSSEVDMWAVVTFRSLRQRVRLREVGEYGFGFVLRYLVFGPGVRTAVFGRFSFVLIGLATLFIIYGSGGGNWFAIFDLGSPLLSDRNQTSLATIVASVASAGIIGVIFLLERGESEIYRGAALYDRFVDMNLFPLVYTLFATVVLVTYYGLFAECTVSNSILLVVSSGISLLVLILLYGRIVGVLAENTISDYFLSQIVRSAINRSIHQERHQIAADILGETVSEYLKYNPTYSPHIGFLPGQNDIPGDQLNLDGIHLSDVNLRALRNAAREIASESRNQAESAELSINTKTPLSSTTKVLAIPFEISTARRTDFTTVLSNAFTARRNQLWGYSGDRFAETIDTLRNAMIQSLRSEQHAKYEEYLDSYAEVASNLFSIQLPARLDIDDSIHRRITGDLRSGFNEALTQNGVEGSTTVSVLNGILLTAKQNSQWHGYSLYLSELHRFIDETYRIGAAASIRKMIAERIGYQAAYLSRTATNSDQTPTNRFLPLNIYLQQSRRTGIVLARTGDFQSLNRFLDGYNQLYESINRATRDQIWDTKKQESHARQSPEPREIFVNDPASPDYEKYNSRELLHLFKEGFDAVRFEIAAAVYTAVKDEQTQTPEPWDNHLDFSNHLYEDSRVFTQGFSRWHKIWRHRGLEPGDVAGPAMDTVSQWDNDRPAEITDAYSNFLLYFEDKNQTKSITEVTCPLSFDELFRSLENLASGRERSVLGVSTSWETVENALDPFRANADLHQIEPLKDVPHRTSRDLAKKFREGVRGQFTLRNHLYDAGEIKYAGPQVNTVEVTEWYSIPKAELRYTDDGVPGLLRKERIAALQSRIVSGWIEGLRKRDELTTETVASPESVYSCLRQQVRASAGEPPTVIMNPSSSLSFQNEELGLEGITWPMDSDVRVIETTWDFTRIPVYHYDIPYDILIIPPETTLQITEPENLSKIPETEVKRLDIHTLREIHEVHPYDSIATDLLKQQWDTILVNVTYNAHIQSNGTAPIAIKLADSA